MKRFPTAIPGFDDILHGGLFEGGVYIVEGPPGVGKTTLANQIAYQYAEKGVATLYLTMLSESHARMVQHMAGQSFFRKAAVNSTVFYISGYRELEQDGLKSVISLLRSELERKKASFLVIDGLVVSAPQIDEGVRQFVHELQSLVTAMDCTCLLLTSGRGNALSAEQTMVDGIFTLENHQFHERAERLIQVRKFRGSEVARGQHSFCITDRGVQFFPRLESLPLPSVEPKSLKRIPFGLPAVDDFLKTDGIFDGSSSLAVGDSGSGKSFVAMQFVLSSPSAGSGLLLLSAPETVMDVSSVAAAVGLQISRAIANGQVHVETIGQADESLDEMGYKILRLVDQLKVKRLVLDSIASLADTSSFPDRGYRFIGRLLHELRVRGVTTLFTLDPAGLAMASGTPLAKGVEALFDNVFSLQALSEPDARRQIALRKIRGSLVHPAILPVGFLKLQ